MTKANKNTAKGTKGTKKAAEKKAPAVKHTIKVLGYSASSFFRWMGSKGYSITEARTVAEKFATAELKPSTITTGLSDGRTGKWGKPAEVTAEDEAKVNEAVGRTAKKAKKSKKAKKAKTEQPTTEQAAE